MNQDHDDDLRFALRGLRQDIAPERDLWSGIAAQLEPRAPQVTPIQAAARRRVRWQPFAVAAAVAVIAVLGMRMTPMLDAPQPAAPVHAPLRAEAVRMTRDYQIALERMQGGGTMPVALAPAVEDLDKSATQILQAIDRDPRSRQLLQTLRYTYDRRLALTRQAALS
ncbi:hypothetical protein SAMN05428989_2271 [Pseudoxanthomonas sp. GM95]|uniref:hypothetical protein n=1 Tax=Pseudoxanthomonas sp. GM95 TaxID=1881043 RepID=UPI0008C1FECD|nr:hypothetical protein [Pseudoxanthomonas sp. GM95]SEL69628.1 hypothetical protein SAMN05428989_2271 [Pseudoxanthomonas sp. GM95]